MVFMFRLKLKGLNDCKTGEPGEFLLVHMKMTLLFWVIAFLSVKMTQYPFLPSETTSYTVYISTSVSTISKARPSGTVLH